MPRAVTIVRKAAVRPGSTVDAVSLDHAGRGRAAGSLTAEGGLAFDLALPKAGTLEDGDALRLDDGRMVAVHAAPEALLEVRAGNPARLLRLAWQLGGSHVPAEVGPEVLFVPDTPAVAELVRGQGCTATSASRPFRPERAAHDHSQCGHDHGQDHNHSHAHGHAHAHDHGHSHASDVAAPAHVHGPGCGHDH